MLNIYCFFFLDVKDVNPELKKLVKTNVKTMIICFFYAKGLCTRNFYNWSDVNLVFFLGFLKSLRNTVRRKWPKMRQSGDWFFHRDNARAHTTILVTTFVERNVMDVLAQRFLSPDVASSDSNLFPRTKRSPKGKHFALT